MSLAIQLLPMLLSQTPTLGANGLSPGGWAIMIASVGFASGLLGWCVYRILRESSAEKIHGQLDVDTHDTQEP